MSVRIPSKPGVTTTAAVGSSPNSAGAAISGQVITLEPADGSNPGVLTTGTQTIAGQKTFSTGVTANVSTSTATATNGSTSRTIANHFADVVNVLDYGAKGDGTTDDSAAIASAFAQNKYVYFPASTYKCNFTVGSNNRIIGAGRQKTIFIANNTSNPVITINETTSSVNNFIGGQDFSVNGQSTASTGIIVGLGTSSGTDTYGDLTRVEIYNCTNNLIIKNTVGFYIDQVYSYSASAGGLVVDDTDLGNDVVTVLKVTNSAFRLNVTGVSLKNGAMLSFDNTIVENNTHYGVFIDRNTSVGARSIKFDNCWFEGNGTSGVGTFSDASSIYITENASLLPSTTFYPIGLQFNNCMIGSDTNAYDVYLDKCSDDALFQYCTFNQVTGVLISGESTTPSTNKLFYAQAGGGTTFAYATIVQCSTSADRPNPTLYSSLPLTTSGDGTKVWGFKYKFYYQGLPFTNSVPTVSVGGTGHSSLATHNLLIGAGTASITTLAPSSTSGVPVISQGASADPAYGAINLAGGSSIVSGVLPNSNTTAVSTNTNSAIVTRDGSGNFSAGTITANLTGTASNVTTNANLTGVITSVGNSTSIASQTGTGSTFVVSAGPSLTGTTTMAVASVTGDCSSATFSTNIRTVDGSTTTRTNLAANGFTVFTGASAITIQGIAAGNPGQRIILANSTGNSITIAHQNGGAVGAQILCSGDVDITIAQHGALELIYDAISGLWRSIKP